MANGTLQPVLPDGEGSLARWRVGLVAYREAKRQGPWEHHAWIAGHEAMRAAFPDLTIEEARRQMTSAIAWCSSTHNEWLWNGVPRPEYIWPPDHRGFGYYRREK
jgi:hypothetical protein